MNKFEKMVQKDAERWAAAEMFYGEGAGTRRKLINAEILTKTQDPAYEIALHEACRKLDMTKFAEAAIKERKAIDRASKAARNFRAARSGNYGNLTNGVAVAVGVYIILNKTGYDKVVDAEIRKGIAWTKMKYKMHKAKVKVVA